MKRFILHSFILACFLFSFQAAVPAAAQTELLGTFSISRTVIDPNATGQTRYTEITYQLLDSLAEVSLVVLEDDSATVVDTLVYDDAHPFGTNKPSWFGTDSLGVLVADGMYILQIRARKDVRNETKTLRVWVDTVAPYLVFQQIVPDVYTPGVPTQPQTVQVVFDVFNSTAPGSVPAGDLLVGAIQVYNPKTGSYVKSDDEIVVFEPSFAGDGRYTALWTVEDIIGLAPGPHQVGVTVTDNAGHSDGFSADFDVNKAGPMVSVTFPSKSGLVFAVIPDSLYGNVFDRHGFDLSSLGVRYSEESPLLPLYSIAMTGDTLLNFSIPLADSVVEERKYTLYLEAADPYEKSTSKTFDIELDRTAPAAPSLDPLAGRTNASEIYLKGTWPGSPQFIRIFRNGEFLDSTFTVIIKELNHRVPLLIGNNVFTATAVDEARNESPLSNSVSIIFENEVGLYVPAPFLPHDEFQINLSQEAYRVSLKVYDLGGELVVALRDLQVKQNYLIPWNGKNGGGEDVKKGPLVAVAEVIFENGENTVYREIFLFDPRY